MQNRVALFARDARGRRYVGRGQSLLVGDARPHRAACGQQAQPRQPPVLTEMSVES
jgi:hypothetical protein